MADLGPWAGPRPGAPTVAHAEVPSAGAGELVLASWHHLLDRGSLQDGEPFLAGTAPRALARVSPATAEAFGLADGEAVTVSTPTGSVSLPVAVEPGMVDHVIWLPANSAGSPARHALGVDAGAVVTVTKGGAA
jgi:NADH-quinone oxidoreductase subunit G